MRIPKTIFWVTVTGWVARLSSIIVNIVIIPIIIGFLGENMFAVFSIMLSLMIWFNLFDFGIGNSLHNYIVESKNSKGYLASAYILIFFVALFGIVLIFIFSRYLGDFLLGKMDFLSEILRNDLILIVCLLLLMNSLVQIASKILFAQRKGYIPNTLQILANTIVLSIFFLISKNTFSGDIFIFTIAYLAPAPTLLFSVMIVIGIKQKLWLEKIKIQNIVTLFQRSKKFWFYALLATITFNIDYIILSQFVLPQEIAIYSIIYKISIIVISISTIMLQAIWPHTIEWITKNEWNNLISVVYKYFSIGFFSIFCFVMVLLFFKGHIFSFLAPNTQMALKNTTIFLFAIYLIIRLWTDVFTVIVLSINDINNLIYWACFQSILSLSMQITFVRIWGVNGILVGLILSSVLTVSWALPIRLIKIKNIGYKKITKNHMAVLPIKIKPSH
jgi:O-antigen/teichoic acid export membrane protein